MDFNNETEFLPFSRPSISRAAMDEVVSCLESGWITTGPRVKKFEAALADYLGAPHVLAVSSATAGLHMMMLALDLKPGDEVITTPLTFAATLNVIVIAGGKPVLVDTAPDSLNIDAQKIARAITPRTRAIMPVHFAGAPVDLDPIYALAQKHNLRVIEDAAHAIGTEYKGKRIGSFGDVQIFSFHPNKNITTGEGGAIALRDTKLVERLSLLRFHGMDREAWDRFGKKGNQNYEIIYPGYKYNMMDIQAAIGLHQLPQLDAFNARRAELANRYTAELSKWDQFILPAQPAYPHKHAWHLYNPLLQTEKAGMDRDTFMSRLKENNIGTGLHYRAAHLFPYYRENFGFKPGDFPNAEKVADSILSLPLFPTLTDEAQDRVIRVMKKVLGR
jgi:dTDP-4-amino-4,6-dideoxygalactose transaminase